MYRRMVKKKDIVKVFVIYFLFCYVCFVYLCGENFFWCFISILFKIGKYIFILLNW